MELNVVVISLLVVGLALIVFGLIVWTTNKVKEKLSPEKTEREKKLEEVKEMLYSEDPRIVESGLEKAVEFNLVELIDEIEKIEKRNEEVEDKSNKVLEINLALALAKLKGENHG